MKTRVVWKENKVISIETSDGIYVLAQMLVSPFLLFFNHFSSDDKWLDVELNHESILFCKAVTRQFLKCSSVVSHIEVQALQDPEISQIWIKLNPNPYLVKIWENSTDEMEFICMGEGGGSLVEINIHDKGLNSGTIVQKNIAFDDVYHIDNYEILDVEIYPNLNERLFLCYKLGKNVDPYKELIFKRPLRKEYKRYFEIMSGKKR
tara:strand:- start:3526 stop:4143 length:618 start_codon:yes stop_codon:yes gene_type:complete